MTETGITSETAVRAIARRRSTPHDVGVLLIRLMLGVVFMFHGSQKLLGWFEGPGMEGFTEYIRGMDFPYAEYSAWLSAGTEFFGGLLLIIGLLTRLVVIPMAFNMLVACYVHWPEFSVQNNGLEYPLTLAIVLIGLGLIGAGRFSVDALICRLFARIRGKGQKPPRPT